MQLLEGTVEATLQVRVGHDQDALLIPRHQADLLRNASVQFVEAGDDVAQVDPGRPSFCYLVEQVIPEKLQQVAIARL